MKRLSYLPFLMVSALMLWACSSDDEVETASYDDVYQVKYYDQDPAGSEVQGRWYSNHFHQMLPQDAPPYNLLMIWNDDKGKEAFDYIVSKNDGVVIKELPYSRENERWLLTNKIIECPYLFVSTAYMEKDDYTFQETGLFTHILPTVIVKMKEGESYEDIQRRYADWLTLDKSYFDKPYYTQSRICHFDCNLKTSREVLRLCSEIHQRDDVEWCEPNMYMPIYYD